MDIILRDLQSDDRNYFYKWIRDSDIIRYSLTLFQSLKTNKEISNWFDTVLEDKKSYSLGIYDNDNKTLLGYAGISAISQVNNSGEYFIFIGEKSYHGKGVGTYVTKEIIRLGFEELNLNRIMLTAAEKNIGAIKAYKKAGFLEEGCMKEAFFRDDEYSNKVIMGLVQSDYKASLKKIY